MVEGGGLGGRQQAEVDDALLRGDVVLEGAGVMSCHGEEVERVLAYRPRAWPGKFGRAPVEGKDPPFADDLGDDGWPHEGELAVLLSS